MSSNYPILLLFTEQLLRGLSFSSNTATVEYRRSVGAPVDEKEVSVSHNPHQSNGETSRTNRLSRQLKKTSPKSADTMLKFTKHRRKWLTLCCLN